MVVGRRVRVADGRKLDGGGDHHLLVPLSDIGQPHAPSKAGEYVAGTVRQRITLASGRFAMIDNGLSFQLVPWSPSLDSQIGKHISGVMRAGGGVDWSFGRGRGLGL